jgi:hypothetical protein
VSREGRSHSGGTDQDDGDQPMLGQQRRTTTGQRELSESKPGKITNQFPLRSN